MRWRARGRVWPAFSFGLANLLSLLTLSVMMASPAGTTADSALGSAGWMTASVPPRGTPFPGTPAVGALFTGGANPGHFCTASVVHSPNRNLVITAAHCLGDLSARADLITFVPGFHDGKAPYGVWVTARVVVDGAWASAHDAGDDVAFLVVTAASGSRRIEDITGAERLRTGEPVGVVRVTGYPNSTDRPIFCQNRATAFTARQMRFACDGFTAGTSGGPFLADVSPTTGNGLVVGVIGGYQGGGNTAAISYSPMFGPNVAALYKTAIAHS
jgi:V8-like Glu-specific endopeptidase